MLQHKLSISGLVRDLLDDRFSDTTIQLCVTKETKKLYDHIISNFGAGDAELERFIVGALDGFLQEKVKGIEALRKRLKQKK